MSTPDRYRDRKYCMVLYPEDPTHTAAIEKLKADGYDFAAILHNEDVYEDGEKKGEKKKEHWHVIVKFPNAVWDTKLAKDLGIERNYLEKCKNVDAALLYLVHYGYEDSKYQYEVSDVFGPLQQRLITLLRDTDEGTRIKNIADIIRNHPGPIGFSELIDKAVAAGLWADLRRMGQFATGLMREHNYEYYAMSQSNAGCKNDSERFQDYLNWTRSNADVWPMDRYEY